MHISRMMPVRPPPAYQVVVEHLRHALQLGRFIPGERLPAERELASQLEVSRTTLRQAIRMLEGEGLIETRRGATGGLFVLQQNYSERQVKAIMAERFAQVEEMYQFRLVIEVSTARIAASQRSAKDLSRLAAALDIMTAIIARPDATKVPDHVARFLAADADFHTGIAAATRNSYLEAAVEEIRAAKFLPIGAVFPKLDASANAGHRELFEAISAKDPDRAAALMQDHVELSHAGLKSLVQAELKARTDGLR